MFNPWQYRGKLLFFKAFIFKNTAMYLILHRYFRAGLAA
jgi:hypothetical protein